MKGSQLCNKRDFYAGHDEWEEVWRRATGTRRKLLHGIDPGRRRLRAPAPRQREGDAQPAASGGRTSSATSRAGPVCRELRDRALADAESARASLTSVSAARSSSCSRASISRGPAQADSGSSSQSGGSLNTGRIASPVISSSSRPFVSGNASQHHDEREERSEAEQDRRESKARPSREQAARRAEARRLPGDTRDARP